jgi:hypothetical protein
MIAYAITLSAEGWFRGGLTSKGQFVRFAGAWIVPQVAIPATKFLSLLKLLVPKSSIHGFHGDF